MKRCTASSGPDLVHLLQVKIAVISVEMVCTQLYIMSVRVGKVLLSITLVWSKNK